MVMTQAILTVSNFIQDGLNGLVDLFSNWKRSRARKAKARQTYRELNNLTDYELRDLGIGRSDIPSIAAGTFDDVRVTKKYETNENLKGWV
tara:strand:+ start:649 stop:921 length:273 start_codon:yes stop_codon:yes gene_type:complete